MNVIFYRRSVSRFAAAHLCDVLCNRFFLDHTSILICADNPVNIFLLTTIVAERSDGTGMGENAFTCRERFA